MLYVAMTSDRGLAGGVHSSISKTIRNELNEKTPEELKNSIIICVGDKSRAFMQRYFPKNLIMVGSEIGRLPPQVHFYTLFYRCIPNRVLFLQFGDAASVANAVLTSGHDFDHGKMLYNKYKSVVSYTTTAIPLFSQGRCPGPNQCEL
jgi:F-type H+-transporting ATPase subunit gamma